MAEVKESVTSTVGAPQRIFGNTKAAATMARNSRTGMG
jgi:hypothetical protein